MIHTICSRIKFRKVVTTEVGGYREVPSAELAEIFCKEGCKDVGNSDNIEEAFHMAHEAKGEDGMLFCVGSLYLVGEIKTLFVEKSKLSAEKRKTWDFWLIFQESVEEFYDRLRRGTEEI